MLEEAVLERVKTFSAFQNTSTFRLVLVEAVLETFFRLPEILLLLELCLKRLFWSEIETFFRLPETLLLLELCSTRLFWSEVETFFRLPETLLLLELCSKRLF